MHIVQTVQTKYNKMRTKTLMISASIVMAAFTACNDNTGNDQAKIDAASFNHYVDSVNKLPPVYTLDNWVAIDNGYQERALKAEAAVKTLAAEDKAKTEASKAQYAALKATYDARLKENEVAKTTVTTTPDFRQVLRNRLFGEGKIGDDMKMGFVTGSNILSVYQNFVDAVADNKNNYTREDWDEIKVLYEALDTRKNAVEKDMTGSDNMKIAGLKIRFASIKATHRGGTKGEENAKAKE